MQIFNDEEPQEKKEYLRAIKYTGDECPHCKRIRVELFENGKKICEKCSYNFDTNEFESEHWEQHN